MLAARKYAAAGESQGEAAMAPLLAELQP